MSAFLPEYGNTLIFATIAALVVLNIVATYICRIRQHRSLSRYNRSKNPLSQIVISNVDGQCIYANRQFLRLNGLSKIRSGELKLSFEWSEKLVLALKQHREKRSVDGLIFPIQINGKDYVFKIEGYSGHYRRKPVWYLSLSDITALYEQQHQLKQQSKDFQYSLDAVDSPICRIALDGKILFCNQTWANFVGLKSGDLKGKYVADVLNEVESSRYRFADDELSDPSTRHLEKWVKFPDGEMRYMEHLASPVRDDEQQLQGYFHTSAELSRWHKRTVELEEEVKQRKETQRQVSRQNSLIRTVLSAAIDPIGFINERGYFIGGNEPFAAMFHCSVDEIRGKHFSDVCETQEQIKSYQEQHQRCLNDGETVRVEELVYLNDDQPVWYEVVKRAFFDEQTQERGIVYMTRDVTERKHTEQQLADAIMQLQELSYVDSLTQVANRRSFDERLRSMWDLHRRDKKELSLLLIDIDCFKQYNDHYGHQQGDEALRQVAKLIVKSTKRGSDIVARYGGEEFAILLPNTDLNGAEQIARDLLERFENAQIEHLESVVSDFLSVSVGVASFVPQSQQDYGELVRAADLCLYQAKDEGRARFASVKHLEPQLNT